jgi:hypothetical protein
MSVKCVTLRVRECVDMITINNQQRDLEIHIDSHIFNEDHYRWTTMSGFINPVYEFLCLAIFYLPEIRSSVSPYLVQSRSQQVLFTRSAIQYHLVIKLINHVFANGVWYWLLSGPGVYLSNIGGTNSISIHATQQVLSDYLRDTFMITLS